MRCLQCQFGNHDNCLSEYFDISMMMGCACWECTEAQKGAAGDRLVERKKKAAEAFRKKIELRKATGKGLTNER